jgi:hypothetical protein
MVYEVILLALAIGSGAFDARAVTSRLTEGRAPSFSLMAGRSAGVARDATSTTVELVARQGLVTGWELALSAGQGTAARFREQRAQLLVGYGLARLGTCSYARAMVRAGGGVVMQQLDARPAILWSPLLTTVVGLGAGILVGSDLAVGVQVTADVSMLRRDSGVEAIVLPTAVVGLALPIP